MKDSLIFNLIDTVYLTSDTLNICVDINQFSNKEITNIKWGELITICLAFFTFIFGFYKIWRQSKDSFSTIDKQIVAQRELMIVSLENQNKAIIHQLKIDNLKHQSVEFINSLRTIVSKIISIIAQSKSENIDKSNIKQLYELFIELQLYLNPKKPSHNELIQLIERILISIDNALIDDLRSKIKMIMLQSKIIILEADKDLNDKIIKL